MYRALASEAEEQGKEEHRQEDEREDTGRETLSKPLPSLRPRFFLLSVTAHLELLVMFCIDPQGMAFQQRELERFVRFQEGQTGRRQGGEREVQTGGVTAAPEDRGVI